MNNISINNRIMNSISWLIIVCLTISCKRDAASGIEATTANDLLSFTTNSQTLPTFIHPTKRQVHLEVAHDADIRNLVPDFKVPVGSIVKVNGVTQTSGSSSVDFSSPVTYEVISKSNNSANWEVLVSPVRCKILIDASHDGGVWWYPQHEATGFDPGKPHQGKAFADVLRSKGFEVVELGRGKELNEEMFFGHYIVVRVNGFEPYSKKELDVYKKLLNRGMNLAFFTDHKMNDGVDELGDLLNIKFEGVANGNVTTFLPHQLTANLTRFSYIAGAVITNAHQNTGIQVLGRLGMNDFADLNMNGVKDAGEHTAPAVMGVLQYPKSRVFFIGDTNGLEIRPQPFINNLIQWMGECF